MSKLKYFIFVCVCFFSTCVVFANDEISIESMISVYDVNSGVIVTEENGEHSVIFNDKDQSVKYNIVLKNNTNKDIPIDNLMLPKPSEDFLKYELTGLNSGDIIKANSTKDVVISLETVKTEGWGRNFDIELTAAVNLDSSVLNPNTNDFVVILFILSIVFGCSVFVLKNKKVARYGILIIGFFSVVPYINADKVYMVPIKINVSFESQNVMEKSYKLVWNDFLDEYIGEEHYFWKYNEKILNIYIQNEINEIIDYAYKFDVSEKQDSKVIAYLVENVDDSNYYDLYLQADGIIYLNTDSSAYFANMNYLKSIDNIEGLDTSNVTDMSYMFSHTGYYSEYFTLDISNLDTSNVTNMDGMFSYTGYSNPNFTLDVSNFDTSNVTNMGAMFMRTGYNSTNFTLDVSNFDTSNVTDMHQMFFYTGYSNPNFTLDVSNFDTSNVTDMGAMFSYTGYNSTNFTLDVSNFDTSNVTDMLQMFSYTGYNSTNFTLDVSNFDTSNVTNMLYMFWRTGYNSTKFTLDVSSFDTSNVTNMQGMFSHTGYSNPNFTLDVSNFDTRNVNNMSGMFSYTGYNSTNFTLDVSNFDTSKVGNMAEMFMCTGYNSTKFNTSITIKTPNVFNYYYMFYDVVTKSGSKITVNYTKDTEALVDKMIATKSSNSNVIKGVQVD